ncbi:DUF4291 family protein [Catellatospora sp. KI3]|uniref:DUF4291 family protein n=1 Tax=Catellatospora sp. KI3 TaxID=3041620 RepID=UPI002483288C|nr:DUF4291 family protein [Catellatospora sp. KI3]MDI1463757.1 DUF4291 family protein [Catellatospora sp. KI3]
MRSATRRPTPGSPPPTRPTARRRPGPATGTPRRARPGRSPGHRARARRHHGSASAWEAAFASAAVHVQWDPERSLRGAALNHYSIQVGVGRTLIRSYAEEWVVGLRDVTPTVHKIAGLVRSGRADQATRLLPRERPYPLPADLARRIHADS